MLALFSKRSPITYYAKAQAEQVCKLRVQRVSCAGCCAGFAHLQHRAPLQPAAVHSSGPEALRRHVVHGHQLASAAVRCGGHCCTVALLPPASGLRAGFGRLFGVSSGAVSVRFGVLARRSIDQRRLVHSAA